MRGRVMAIIEANGCDGWDRKRCMMQNEKAPFGAFSMMSPVYLHVAVAVQSLDVLDGSLTSLKCSAQS